MKVMVRGNWANYVGTDYCHALGIYDNLEDAEQDAATLAWDCFEEEPEDTDEETGEYHGEGPDYWVEEYDPAVHEGLRVGGGSFTNDFASMN